MNLLVIDGNCLAFNSFYKLKKRDFAKKPDGTVDMELFAKEGAYSFARILSWLLSQYRPRHLLVVVDKGGETFRHKMFPSYKAQRKEASPEFNAMMTAIECMMQEVGIACISAKGYEADDVIASAIKKFNVASMIVTGDKDLFQLIDVSTRVAYTAGGMSDIKVLDRKSIRQMMGVYPEQIVDYKALAGDKRDNYGGLPGMGAKNTVELLNQYGTAEKAYENPEEINKIYRTNFLRNKEKYENNKKLASLVDDVPIEIELQQMRFQPEYKNIRRLFRKIKISMTEDGKAFLIGEKIHNI